MGAYRLELLCGVFFFRLSRAWVWMCVCDRYASLHDALLSCSQLPGFLVVTTGHFVLTSLISGKAFGRGGVILPEHLSGSTPCGHAMMDFIKPVGQAATHLHFQTSWLYPRSTKLTQRNVLQALTEMSYEVSHLLIF